MVREEVLQVMNDLSRFSCSEMSLCFHIFKTSITENCDFGGVGGRRPFAGCIQWVTHSRGLGLLDFT